MTDLNWYWLLAVSVQATVYCKNLDLEITAEIPYFKPGISVPQPKHDVS